MVGEHYYIVKACRFSTGFNNRRIKFVVFARNFYKIGQNWVLETVFAFCLPFWTENYVKLDKIRKHKTEVIAFKSNGINAVKWELFKLILR